MSTGERRGNDGLVLVATGAEARALDRLTIEPAGGGPGVPGRVLMELAGAGCVRAIQDRLGISPRTCVVLCGSGNNGGDGFVVARMLAYAGWDVTCVALQPLDVSRGDAGANSAVWASCSGTTLVVSDGRMAAARAHLAQAGVVVDALFGVGLSRPMVGAAAELIDAANASEAFRVAVDIPSGVHAVTGAVVGGSAGMAFIADLTATFGCRKVGLCQGAGSRLAGEVVVVDIGLSTAALSGVELSHRFLDEEAVVARLPLVPLDGHKGTFGHVGVVGGRVALAGAGWLACRAALRGGAGLVTWVTDAVAASTRDAEVMAWTDAAPSLPPRPSVWVVGPGLGNDESARAWVDAVALRQTPTVIDADALHLCRPMVESRRDTHEQWLLTPHPKEAASMLGTSVTDVLADPAAAAREVASKFSAVVLLKGSTTCVATSDGLVVHVSGHAPALAVGGSGDVLAGLCGALMARGLSPFDAALVGCWVHRNAGRELGRLHPRGGLAREIADACAHELALLQHTQP